MFFGSWEHSSLRAGVVKAGPWPYHLLEQVLHLQCTGN